MPTRIREHATRPHAGRTWLLALVVAGILGMHGLSAGGGHAAHPDSPATTTTPAATAHDGHSGHPVGASSDLAVSTVVADEAGIDGDPGGTHEPSFVMLCVVMVLALALGMTVIRRTTWVSSPARARTRLTLPATPLLRDRTPVPRFTVMRC